MQAKLVQGIEHVDADAWDACAGAGNPFLGHAFLLALEQSGSASGNTGWLPLHTIVEDDDGKIVACAPAYLKSHSYGEYVFDHGWAHAYERVGGRYYPKLQVAVPFTPVPGPRLLARPGACDGAKRALIGALLAATEQIDASSLHVTFCDEADWRLLGEAGLLLRSGVQYHWHNRGYRDFDDFLGHLRASKRKMIRKERAKVREQNVEIETLSGAAITPAHWRAFYPFYRSTVDKRWGSAYLTRRFFERLGSVLAERVVLVMAKHDGRYVGGALNLRGEDALYGRVWGCLEEFRFLHFEACYYAAIDYAIEHGLARVEAGAQGQHKIMRGYEPTPTHSAHQLRDSGLRDAVARFLAAERRQIAADIVELRELLPFSRADA